MKIALTGHTTARLRGKEAEVNDWLDNVLTALLIQAQEDEEVEFLCGGADGAEARMERIFCLAKAPIGFRKLN